MPNTNLRVQNASLSAPLRLSRSSPIRGSKERTPLDAVAVVPPLGETKVALSDHVQLVYESPAKDEALIEISNSNDSGNSLRVFTQSKTKGGELGALEHVAFLPPIRNGSTPAGVWVPLSAACRIVVEQLPT